ncbi:hypothetical protein ABEB36_002381 [Hypothenemus hampei]|uniref:Uncharacterized protein n=1 Tax=Hypothenemus hampei TaxID=57062 RepID=A0ABD1F778_HYPHA
MSPKKLPLSLNVICLKLLSNQLIHALSDEEGLHQAEVQEYMTPSTYHTLQYLLNEILGLINLDASIRFSCLQVLLREDVKRLEIGIFPRFYYDKILETISENGRGLHHLNLKGVWARDYPELLSNLLTNTRHLKALIIPHMADDSVINSIINLKSLVKLDISGEACYTSIGISKLNSDTIRILDIGSFGKPNLCQDCPLSGYELMAEIIKNLPNLNVLKTYSFTGHALLHLYKDDHNFKTKLTYIHTTDCNLDILNAIANTCPHLENIHVNRPQEKVVRELSKIPDLRSLKLTKGNGDEFLSFLKNAGEKLHQIKLNHNKSSLIDISNFCEYTPNINSLEFYHMYLKFSNLDSFYVNLQKVQILYCDIDDTVVKSMLTNAPFLKSITVGCSIQMTDGDMFRLLGECTLENIEELLFSEARFLTAITVELLADNCPKLKVLGSLVGWDITPDEIDALRVLISITNTDLTLWPVAY